MIIHIRKIETSEIAQLKDFLYDAIFIPQGVAKPDKSIIETPALRHYIKDFGKDSDICLIAAHDDDVVGAIWSRVFPETEKGYGYVDKTTPELSMSVKEAFRGKGIGKQLLAKMLEELSRAGYQRVSLSVDKGNFAFNLYQKMGFEIFSTDDTTAIMIKVL